VKLLSELLSTDYGMMSAAVIVVTLGLGVWYVRFFLRRMNEDAQAARK